MVHQVSPITIDLEGTPVAKVDRYQGGDTTYQTVVSWTVSPNRKGWLQEVSMITNNFEKTLFRLKIADETLFEDKQIQTSLTLPFPWNELDEGSVVLLECRSIDGTAIVEHIAATFEELQPIYNLLAGVEKLLNEKEQIALAHLLSGRNLIFYGPPGTGKTRRATEMAERICGEENYTLVTANAEWTAYDVIGGLIQSEEGFRFRPGFFTLAIQNCIESQKKGKPHWLIIDEINRANLDLSFGKVFTLFDLDYRKGHSVIDESMLEKLAEEDKEKYGNLNIPPEFRILATMNTYDRAVLFSLGYAFRRRFAFVEVPSPYSMQEEEKYTINEAEWRVEKNEELIRMKREFEDEMDRVWKKNLYFRLLRKGSGMERLEDVVSQIRELDTKVRGKQLDPFNPYVFAHELSKFVAEQEIVEVGYGQIMDIIRFALTYTAIFSQEDPRRGMVRALDDATKAYFLPLVGYYLPRARRMMTIGKQEEDPLEKLESLERFFEQRGLRKSERKTRELRSDLERGEITLF